MLTRPWYAQRPRQHAFATDLGRYARNITARPWLGAGIGRFEYGDVIWNLLKKGIRSSKDFELSRRFYSDLGL